MTLPVVGGATTIWMVAVRSPPPLAPTARIVAVYVPLGTPALRIPILALDVVTLVGVTLAMSKAGSPVVENVIAPVYPGSRTMSTVGR